MSNSWRNSKDYWKAPVLQGEENDYGEYDFLIEDIPDNYSEWAMERAKYKCDCCGKYRHLLRESYAYFYTMDGYDYMAQYDCWACVVKGKLYVFKNKLMRKFNKWSESIKTAYELKKASKGTMSFWSCYKNVKELKVS